MMKRVEDLNFYELLEVDPGASSQEIHRAYERIRKVYEPNSVALYSLFTPDETETIRARIEEAYRTLIYEDNRVRYDAMLRAQGAMPEPPALPPQRTGPARTGRTGAPPAPERRPAAEPPPASGPSTPKHDDIASVSQLVGEFTGPAIRLLREQRGKDLRAIADITRVGMRFLEYIEEEDYRKLPARAYVRGFLQLYAKALGCDPERLASDYLKRYDAAMNPPKK